MNSLESFLESEYIEIYEPFAEFLGGSRPETHFQIRLLDVVRLAGHFCRSVTGGFLVTRHAAQILFPNSPLERGQLKIRLPGSGPRGALGPISQVMGYLSGAWGESGFGGLGGEKFVRKDLLSYSPEVPEGHYEFQHIETGEKVLLRIRTEIIPAGTPSTPFQAVWRQQILFMLQNSESIVEVVK